MSSPLGTLTTKGSYAVIEPKVEPADDSFLLKYYGTGTAASIDEPLDTITTRDRFGLVTIEGTQYRIDIRLRMLEPKELAAAHSMENYRFHGGRAEVVKQIGNGVPSKLSEALTGAILNSVCNEVDETVDIVEEIEESRSQVYRPNESEESG